MCRGGELLSQGRCGRGGAACEMRGLCSALPVRGPRHVLVTRKLCTSCAGSRGLARGRNEKEGIRSPTRTQKGEGKGQGNAHP